MSGSPLITVLLCFHNDRAYLATAVRSILQQTMKDFEFLIYDDASSDGSAELLAAFGDPRIQLRRNQTNLGLTRTLNLGLLEARGQFLARMDGDDIADPQRLELQLQFMREHRDVGLLGTSRTLIDESDRLIAHAPAQCDDLSIRFKSLLGNPFAHPSVFMRMEILRRHGLRYDESFPTAQDYDLWVRMLMFTAGANLLQPLLKYRLRGGISKNRKLEQLASHDRISLRAIAAFAPGFSIQAHELRQLRGRFGGHSVRDPSLDPADPYWQGRHAELRAAFIAHHRDHPDIGRFTVDYSG
ncbi:MAG: glycosyltransferase family 2 protein [Phycisphaerales bacterium]|jgi:glycosyltransferase involved in cell wall biosynthesis|nr:glycosyltransferase family 2 protein [Phycisphaerales bacterium]